MELFAYILSRSNNVYLFLAVFLMIELLKKFWHHCVKKVAG